MKRVAGKMSVFPLDVHPFTGGKVDLHGFWVDGRHNFSIAKNEGVGRPWSFVVARKSLLIPLCFSSVNSVSSVVKGFKSMNQGGHRVSQRNATE